VRIKFVLVCEGSSDRGLVPHLETLCVRAGATEAVGEAPDLARLPVPPGKTVSGQVSAVMRLGAEINLLFVHRDSDGRDPRIVRRQITEEVSSLVGCPVHVCVVPVQEIEAWLLTDEDAIRQVSGKPGGREPLRVPPRRQIEGTASPKEILKEAIAQASGRGGADWRRFAADSRSSARSCCKDWISTVRSTSSQRGRRWSLTSRRLSLASNKLPQSAAKGLDGDPLAEPVTGEGSDYQQVGVPAAGSSGR